MTASKIIKCTGINLIKSVELYTKNYKSAERNEKKM